MIGTIIVCGVLVSCALILYIWYFLSGGLKILDNFDTIVFIGGSIIVAIILCGTILLTTFLYSNLKIKELTVYENGNIELTATNIFGDNKTENLSFSEYSVEKDTENSCDFGKTSKIKLTQYYYEKYKIALKNKKTVTMKINE